MAIDKKKLDDYVAWCVFLGWKCVFRQDNMACMRKRKSIFTAWLDSDNQIRITTAAH